MTIDACMNCGDDDGLYKLCLDCLSSTEVPDQGALLLTATATDVSDFIMAAREHNLSLQDWAMTALREAVYR